MAPDTKAAQQYFKENSVINGRFSQYSAAYSITNENLRMSLSDTMPKNTQNALVVAGSGDHPIFTNLYGGKNIDTFDISCNAKCIMDIKTNAIQLLSYKDYRDLVFDLYFSTDVTKLDGMDKIMSKMPKEEQEYIYNMRNHAIFGRGIAPFLYEQYLPTEAEYDQLRQNIKKPFNFIWSDITSLHLKLDKKYDFMHLSNILDYYTDDEDRAYVLILLMNHLNPNGVICFETFRFVPRHLRNYRKPKSEEWVIKKHKKDDLIHVMQRIK